MIENNQDMLGKLQDLLGTMSAKDKKKLTELAQQATEKKYFIPNPGPQTEAYFSEADILLYGGFPGAGKDIDINCKIVTASGYTKMKDISVGDRVVDIEGNLCNVIAVSDIFTDNQCFEFTFDTGETIICGAGHQWLVKNDIERKKDIRCTKEWREKRKANRPSRALKDAKNKGSQINITKINQERVYEYDEPLKFGRIRTAQEIYETQNYNNRSNYSIELCSPCNFSQVELPIEPYLLGLWLGNGRSKDGTIGMMRNDWENINTLTPVISSRKLSVPINRQEMLDKRFEGLKANLKSLNLLKNKHIPQKYLRASFKDRLSLFQGIMDTDGTCGKDGHCELGLSNKNLMTNVFELVSSLGIKAKITIKELSKKNKNHNDCYRIHFISELPIFRLPRKLERQKTINIRPSSKRRFIKSVKSVPPVKTRCIQVDSPTSTFLIGKSFIATHNSSLLNGLALNEHKNSLIVRRQFADLDGLVRDCREIARTKNPELKGFVGGTRPKYRKPEGGEIVFEGVETNGQIDMGKQGNARDFIGVDEGAQLPLDAIMMLYGWNRSNDKNQRCRMVIASNPPVSSVGDWMAVFFAPWLDPDYHDPAQYGELRYFYIDSESRSIQVPSKEPFELDGMTIYPHSRTFIPGKLKDNPFLGAEYEAKIQAIPEPARSIFLSGNFLALRTDQEFQVIPSDWVKAAMARREQYPFPPEGIPLCSMGVDIAAGGKDNTTIFKRYDWWFEECIEKPGIETPLGRDVAGLIMSHYQNNCDVTLDMSGGYGSGVWECLVEVIDRKNIHAFKGAENAIYRTKDGVYGFFNARAGAYWKLREALDPSQLGGSPICLPDDKKLLAQLTAPRFEITTRGIKITPKIDLVKELGYSPDRADALVMAYYYGKVGLTGHANYKKLQNKSNNIKVNLGHSLRKSLYRGRK